MCLRAAADLFMNNEKLTWSIPSSTGEGPHQPRSTTFPGIRLGTRESQGLSRQCGLTIGLGWTIKIHVLNTTGKWLQQCLKDLADRVDKCLLNQGCWVLFVYNWNRNNCLLYRVAGWPLFNGCLSIEVNGRTVGTFRIICYVVGVHC